MTSTGDSNSDSPGLGETNNEQEKDKYLISEVLGRKRGEQVSEGGCNFS
jgi:hypothetical protein